MNGTRPSLLSDAQLLSLLDHTAEGVYFVDRARRILHWNRGAERISGYAASEVLGRYCGEILLHADGGGAGLCGAVCPLTRVLDTGRRHCVAAWLRHRDGHRVRVSLDAAAYTEPESGLTGAVEVFREEPAGTELVERRVRPAYWA